MAAGPKEERINLLQEQEEEEEEEVEEARVRSGGKLPPKVSSVGLPCLPDSSSYSLKTKISTCAIVVAMQRRSMHPSMLFVIVSGQTLPVDFLAATVMRRNQVPRSSEMI